MPSESQALHGGPAAAGAAEQGQAAAAPNQSLLWSAARESRRIATSRRGVSVPATAA